MSNGDGSDDEASVGSSIGAFDPDDQNYFMGFNIILNSEPSVDQMSEITNMLFDAGEIERINNIDFIPRDDGTWLLQFSGVVDCPDATTEAQGLAVAKAVEQRLADEVNSIMYPRRFQRPRKDLFPPTKPRRQ